MTREELDFKWKEVDEAMNFSMKFFGVMDNSIFHERKELNDFFHDYSGMEVLEKLSQSHHISTESGFDLDAPYYRVRDDNTLESCYVIRYTAEEIKEFSDLVKNDEVKLIFEQN